MTEKNLKEARNDDSSHTRDIQEIFILVDVSLKTLDSRKH
jgi:hypothetical protein